MRALPSRINYKSPHFQDTLYEACGCLYLSLLCVRLQGGGSVFEGAKSNACCLRLGTQSLRTSGVSEPWAKSNARKQLFGAKTLNGEHEAVGRVIDFYLLRCFREYLERVNVLVLWKCSFHTREGATTEIKDTTSQSPFWVYSEVAFRRRLCCEALGETRIIQLQRLKQRGKNDANQKARARSRPTFRSLDEAVNSARIDPRMALENAHDTKYRCPHGRKTNATVGSLRVFTLALPCTAADTC